MVVFVKLIKYKNSFKEYENKKLLQMFPNLPKYSIPIMYEFQEKTYTIPSCTSKGGWEK